MPESQEATLEQVLKQLSKEGELYEKLPDGRLRCFACGHRCLISEGRSGVCRVRYNSGGKLMVPTGYVGALQLDPVEKKPFFHALPGSRAMSFGMLGCDFHCSYCVTADTRISTTQGEKPLGELFTKALKGRIMSDGGEIKFPPQLLVYSHLGKVRRVRGLFRHPYRGRMVVLKTDSNPSVQATPHHRFLAVLPSKKSKTTWIPNYVDAEEITTEHFLLTPKTYLGNKKRYHLQDESYFYIPVRSIEEISYEGSVFNLEVEEDHSYLANSLVSKNCQNWVTSQSLRDPMAGSPPQQLTPDDFVQLSKKYDAKIVTSTYNEPLITSEWGVEIFKIAKREGLVTSYVSNGNGTREVLEYIHPWVDLYKVDLKSFNDQNYRRLGGALDNVLKTIPMLYQMGFWLEIVTLVIPGFNDSDEELKQIADFLVGVSPDIPWHVTAFHKDYKMTDPDNTSVETLLRAADIGVKAGLKFVYAGNLPGMVGDFENTCCPDCKELLIERYGFKVLQNRLTNEGKCLKCQAKIPGFWG